MIDTDELLSSNSDGIVMDSTTMATEYLKMKNICINIGIKIQADLKIHDHHILPRYLQMIYINIRHLFSWQPIGWYNFCSITLNHFLSHIEFFFDFRNVLQWCHLQRHVDQYLHHQQPMSA